MWFRKGNEAQEERREGHERRRFHPMRLLGAGMRALRALFRAIAHFVKKMLRFLFIASGIVAVSIVVVLVGGLFAPDIITVVDKAAPEWVDKQFGTDRHAPSRLHDPYYYAEQTEVVGPDGKTKVACISSPEHRIKIDAYADIPPLFRSAILASEDKSFFEHIGVDMPAIYRAFGKTILNESSSGASTITMQIAKELRQGVGHRSTSEEKIRDIIMALRLDRMFVKEQLFLRYVNMPYFGRGQYGIETASRGYFGRPARDLLLHQVALIVAMINRPALPDRQMLIRVGGPPRTLGEGNWSEVKSGARRVLERMIDLGFITSEEFARASDAIDNDMRSELVSSSGGCGVRDYFMESVRVAYADRFRVNTGGLTIGITRDDELQEQLKYSVEGAVRTYRSRHANDPEIDELRAGALAVRFDGAVLAEVGNVDFRRVKYDAMRQAFRQPGSTFKPFTYGGLVEKQVNELLLSANPPETLSDLVDKATKACVVLDAPVGVSLGRGRGVHVIQNFHSRSKRTPQYWGTMTCKQALGRSQNTAAIRAGQKAGIAHVIELTYRLGMPKDDAHPLQPYPTTAIGASEVNPLGMSGLIAFVNGGYKVIPRFVNDICKDGRSLVAKDDDGRPLVCDLKGERKLALERVLHPATAIVMTDVLRGPVDDSFGTVASLRRGVIPFMDPLGSEIWKLSAKERAERVIVFSEETSGAIAGKTGTATNADGRTSDVWLLLFIPGPEAAPEKGVMLIFWMGKDSKDHALGDRGRMGGGQVPETGGRNWTNAAAPVLKFLQEKRGLLKPGSMFRPVYQDGVLLEWSQKRPREEVPVGSDDEPGVVDPFDPMVDSLLLRELNDRLSAEAQQEVLPTEKSESQE
jgi:membrane peptidoglycan carboxypeptidase